MTAYTYALSEFTSLVADVGHLVLREEIAAAIPGVALHPRRVGCRFIDDAADPTYQCDFDGTLDAGEETALDGVIADHVGPAAPAGTPGAELNHQHVWDPNTNVLRYIPWRTEEESTSVGSGKVRNFFSGPLQLLEIVAWSVGSSGTGISIFGLHRNNNATPSATVTETMGSTDTPVLWDFRGESGTTVSDLEAAAISCDPQNDPGGDIVAWSRWVRV